MWSWPEPRREAASRSARVDTGQPGRDDDSTRRRMSIGAAPGLIDASIHGRCAGEGFGVHICTGLVFGDDA